MIPKITTLLPVAGDLERRMSSGPKPSCFPGAAVPCKEKGRIIDPALFKKSPWIYMLSGVKANRAILEDPANRDLEFFVKRTICDPLMTGHVLKLSRVDGGHDNYTVYRKIASDGLVSYALTPQDKELPPLLVFRCTEPDVTKEASIESIQNDFNRNIGQRGWEANKKAFEELMNDPQFRKPSQKVKVAGYSLGGLHANIFTGHYHRDVEHVISYSAPSMTGKIAEQFAKEINETVRDKPLVIQVLRTRGDPCHLAGEKQLGYGIDSKHAKVQLLEAVVPENQGFDFAQHSKLVFTDEFDHTFLETTNPQKLKDELHNLSDKRGSSVERARQIIGPPISAVLNVAEHLTSLRQCLKDLFYRNKKINPFLIPS